MRYFAVSGRVSLSAGVDGDGKSYRDERDRDGDDGDDVKSIGSHESYDQKALSRQREE